MRSTRHLTCSALTVSMLVCACLVASLASAEEPSIGDGVGAIERGSDIVWRLHANPISEGLTLRDVRLVSPTTYVRGERANVTDSHTIEVFDATIYGRDYSLDARRLTIDLSRDAVEIVTLGHPSE